MKTAVRIGEVGFSEGYCTGTMHPVAAHSFHSGQESRWHCVARSRASPLRDCCCAHMHHETSWILFLDLLYQNSFDLDWT